MTRPKILAAAAGLLLGVSLGAPAGVLAAGDPYRDQQWALDVLRVPEAWTVTRGAGSVVAVIDTGIDHDHPDLRDRVLRSPDGQVRGLDLVDGGEPRDTHGHGTLVAGIIAATAGNGVGIAGVAPEAMLLPIRVLDGDGTGQGEAVDHAIRWAVDQGADVINLSLEATRSDEGALTGPGASTAAVRYAWEHGVVVVAAAGNEHGAAARYPADSPILLVGAVDRHDQPANDADLGRSDVVFAPGVDIVSTWCRSPGTRTCDGSVSYGLAEGTSFAAPHVAGVAALLASAGHDHTEIVTRIRRSAVDLGPAGADERFGEGRVDAAAALGIDGSLPGAARADDPGAQTADAADTAPAATPAQDPPPQVLLPSPTRTAPAPETPPTPDEPVVLLVAPPADGPLPADGIVLELLAATLIGVAMALWSRVARGRTT